MARYSGVRGAALLVLPGSHRVELARSHWPLKSGYLPSSAARAPTVAKPSAASASQLGKLRPRINALLAEPRRAAAEEPNDSRRARPRPRSHARRKRGLALISSEISVPPY